MIDKATAFVGQNKKIVAGVGLSGIGVFAGYLAGVDPQMVIRHLSEVSQNQIAQSGFFFTLAAWLHSGRVKAEIAKQFTFLTTSIEGVGDSLGKELADHRKILENHGQRIEKLETK